MMAMNCAATQLAWLFLGIAKRRQAGREMAEFQAELKTARRRNEKFDTAVLSLHVFSIP
jgi:hypothetical protein